MAAETPVCDFGRRAVDFDLIGVDGKRYRLADIRGQRGTLVMFICNHCPYVRAIIERLVDEVGELKAHGVGAVAIMSNDVLAYPEDSFDKMKEFAHQHNFDFPYAIDETQAVAKAYGAVCTPDFFGFNASLELQYRGRMDASRRELVAGARRELFEAMTTIAATGQGPRDQTPSMGCSIKWRQAA
ncbi:MAG: thioredoxin family protein [Rhodospirillaceae bacterium]|nr:thioredoxin family protein [Rhodospirillaceae bacterium]